MKSKNTNKYDILFDESADDSKQEVLDKLIASKKTIQRSRMSVQFSTEAPTIVENTIAKESNRIPTDKKTLNPSSVDNSSLSAKKNTVSAISTKPTLSDLFISKNDNTSSITTTTNHSTQNIDASSNSTSLSVREMEEMTALKSEQYIGGGVQGQTPKEVIIAPDSSEQKIVEQTKETQVTSAVSNKNRRGMPLFKTDQVPREATKKKIIEEQVIERNSERKVVEQVNSPQNTPISSNEPRRGMPMFKTDRAQKEQVSERIPITPIIDQQHTEKITTEQVKKKSIPLTSSTTNRRQMPMFKTDQGQGGSQQIVSPKALPVNQQPPEKIIPTPVNKSLVNVAPFNNTKRMPIFKTDRFLLSQRDNVAKGEQDKIVPQVVTPPPLPKKIVQEVVKKERPVEQKITSPMNESSEEAQHVTDSPYTEQPAISEGKNLVLRSQEVDDILSYVPNWMIRWGNTVILLILGGLLLMSFFIKYPDVVAGAITINSSYPPVPLVAKATGPITLFKADKDMVAEDEAIGVIKSTANYKDIVQLKNVLEDFQKKLDNNWSFASYELPRGLQLGMLQNSYNQLFMKLKEQKIQYQSDKNNTTRKANINQQLEEVIAIKKAKEKSLSIKYQGYLNAKNLLESRYRVLYKKGSISSEQLNAKENEVRQLLDIYQNDRMSFNEIKKRILDLNSNKVELDFREEDQQILSESSLIAAFESLKADIHNWEKTYVLKAPIAGKLSFIQFTRSDMYLQQEQQIANIIPSNEGGIKNMIGELIIPSIGSGKAAIGQEINIELHDYPKKQFGVVIGKVESISNVTVPIQNGDGITGYKVMVSFPDGLVNTLKKDIQFKHKMQGKAEIITEDIRLIERFFHVVRDIVDAN